MFKSFFKLGHKFIPSSSYCFRTPLVMLEELRETQRKVAWHIAMDGYQDDRPIYVKYKKGTFPNKLIMDKYSGIFDNIAVEQSNYVKNNARATNKIHSAAYWKRTLRELVGDGRFMCCDKNLGVRHVDIATYKMLAEKERRNYEIEPDISGGLEKYREGIISAMLSNLRDIISSITVEVTRLANKFGAYEQRDCLKQIADFIRHSIAQDQTNFHLPGLRMTLKIHKSIKVGELIPTRPIVPNCALPNFAMAKWVGSFMSRLARQIPWNIESTAQFQKWLLDPLRGPRVRNYDFTNLYGNEPVSETLNLFHDALDRMNWKFPDEEFRILFTAMMTNVTVPVDSGLRSILGNKTKLIILLLGECVRCTIAELDLGEKTIIVATTKFLAMGCPPVAPLSIITLGLLEINHIGYDRCVRGLGRLIDDITCDHDIISEKELRAAYPPYLTLNYADDNHYLDLAYSWDGEKFATWPYVKPYVTVPLSFFSQHPYHTLVAAAKNELKRFIGLTSVDEAVPAWVEYWFKRYELASYPTELLTKILRQIIHELPTQRLDKDRGINHVEKWRGVKTSTAKQISKETKCKVSTAWSVEQALLGVALKAHMKRV